MRWSYPGGIGALFVPKAGETRALFNRSLLTSYSHRDGCVFTHIRYPYLLSPLSTT
jgi:hypothetical protein